LSVEGDLECMRDSIEFPHAEVEELKDDNKKPKGKRRSYEATTGEIRKGQ
jgi:hypothetical protein